MAHVPGTKPDQTLCLFRCRFGTIVVDGYHDASNIMKAYCVAPMMTQTGPITLYVSNDQGMTYKYSTYYTVGK